VNFEIQLAKGGKIRTSCSHGIIQVCQINGSMIHRLNVLSTDGVTQSCQLTKQVTQT